LVAKGILKGRVLLLLRDQVDDIRVRIFRLLQKLLPLSLLEATETARAPGSRLASSPSSLRHLWVLLFFLMS
jgi:hypothetical protein